MIRSQFTSDLISVKCNPFTACIHTSIFSVFVLQLSVPNQSDKSSLPNLDLVLDCYLDMAVSTL